MLLLIAVTSFATVALGLLAVARRPADPVEARAKTLGLPPGGGRGIAVPLLRGERVSPAAGRVVQVLRRSIPQRWYGRIERVLTAAGDPVDPGLILLLWVAMVVAGAAVGAVSAGPRGLAVLGLLGGYLPYLWLSRTMRRRQLRITVALPDAADLLVACVEAGLALDAALIRVAAATDGPLGDEIQLALSQISVGRPRQEALLDLGVRTGVTDLDGLLQPIIQAERAGASVGDALRVQAELLRERRRQRAKEKAEKLPAQMIIPMAVFFMPAMMIVGIGPAVFTLIKIFSGHGVF